MYYCWILIIFVFYPCNAQEHLTCMRTDDVINQSPQITTTNERQGRPGRRGPQGLKGAKGDFVKGMKGDPGVPDNSLINSVRDDITRFLQRGFMELDDGWITPFNGYQYKVNVNTQTWDESRIVCQSWGGELIVHGFRDHTAKETITRELNLIGYYWIGLNDKDSEGHWRWVNGNRASTDDVTLWRSGQPNNSGGNQDCGYGYFTRNSRDQFRAGDDECFSRHKSICEKLI